MCQVTLLPVAELATKKCLKSWTSCKTNADPQFEVCMAFSPSIVRGTWACSISVPLERLGVPVGQELDKQHPDDTSVSSFMRTMRSISDVEDASKNLAQLRTCCHWNACGVITPSRPA